MEMRRIPKVAGITKPPFGSENSLAIVKEAGDEEKHSLVKHCDNFNVSSCRFRAV